MFLFWTGSAHRPTRDLDLLSLTFSELDDLERIVKDVCEIECPEDGVLFDSGSVTSESIREELAYGGSRLKLVGYLGTARVPLQIDVGIGDAVTPGPIETMIPGIVSTVPGAMINGYPVETAIAEKFHAMVVLGLTNSRMKDYFDIAFLASSMSINADTLRRAVVATFNRRKTELPTESPICFRPEFASDALIDARWRAFVRKNGISGPFSDLHFIQSTLRDLLLPTIER